MLGHNIRAVSEFYTRTAKMPGKCPVSDCYLELCNMHVSNIKAVAVIVSIHTYFNQTIYPNIVKTGNFDDNFNPANFSDHKFFADYSVRRVPSNPQIVPIL